MFYSLNKVNVSFLAQQQPNGSWRVTCYISDTYDFTEITTLMGSEMSASLGTIANDAAVISQDRGAIQPYSISISVDIWRDL